MTDQTEPNPWELADLCAPWCVHVAATLRLADRLAAAPLSLEALAAEASCDAVMLGLVLRHLIRRGVFVEPGPGVFANNATSRQLQIPAVMLGLDLDSLGVRMAHAWGTMLELVRTGKPAYATRF